MHACFLSPNLHCNMFRASAGRDRLSVHDPATEPTPPFAPRGLPTREAVVGAAGAARGRGRLPPPWRREVRRGCRLSYAEIRRVPLPSAAQQPKRGHVGQLGACFSGVREGLRDDGGWTAIRAGAPILDNRYVVRWTQSSVDAESSVLIIMISDDHSSHESRQHELTDVAALSPSQDLLSALHPPRSIDILVRRDTSAIVITGPNTGGKTAAIKVSPIPCNRI